MALDPISLVLDRLLAIPKCDRRPEAERACAGRPDLLKEVLSLLDFTEEAAQFLNPLSQRIDAVSESSHPTAVEDVSIPGFELISVLGYGASGIVYRARQDQPQREVAIKILHSDVASANAAARLRAEAHLLARLNHPKVASVFQIGQLKSKLHSRPYIVMEFKGGVPLSELLREPLLTPTECVFILAEICDIVHFAHESGVLHRDIKPSNILVKPSPDGHQQVSAVIDFGIAKLIRGTPLPDVAITEEGHLIGTARYMSPERLDGSDPSGSVPSDVYSLGVLGLQLLSQHPDMRKGVLIERVLARMTASDPGQRIQTAATAANELRAAVSMRTVKPERVARARNRRLACFGAAIAASLALSAGLSGDRGASAPASHVLGEYQSYGNIRSVTDLIGSLQNRMTSARSIVRCLPDLRTCFPLAFKRGISVQGLAVALVEATVFDFEQQEEGMHTKTLLKGLLIGIAGSTTAAQTAVPSEPEGVIVLDPTHDSIAYDILMGGAPSATNEAATQLFGESDYDQTGQGVATGDFNGDGVADLVVSASWAREKKLLQGGGVVQSGLGAGKVYILYGDPTVTTPLDPSMKRNGQSSDQAGYSLSLHPDYYGFLPGEDETTHNPLFPHLTSYSLLDDPWYNLFDVEGERRLNGTGGDEDSDNDGNPDARFSGAVLFGQNGYRSNDGSTADGSAVTHVFDAIPSRSGTGLRGLYYRQPRWDPATDAVGSGMIIDSDTSGGSEIDQVGDFTGVAIANAGDVNGDGIDDLLIGAEGYAHQAHEPTAADLNLPAGSNVIARGNDTGIVYLIFGTPGGLHGAHSLADVGSSTIPGVQFIGSGMHMKLGRDVRNGSSLFRDPVTGVGSSLDFNGDGLADFVLGSQTVDSGEVIPLMNLQGQSAHTPSDPNGDGNTSDAHPFDAIEDPDAIDNGIGAAYIIYGEQAANPTTDRNPWSQSTYYLPSEFSATNVAATTYSNNDGAIDGACITGHTGFGYLGYASFAGDFDGDGFADIAVAAPNHDSGSAPAPIWSHENLGELYIIFGDDEELRGIHEARGLVGSEIGSTNQVRAISILGGLNTAGDYDASTVFPTGQYANVHLLQGSDMGWSVMAAGDVDADGKAEVIVGAPDITTAPGGANLTQGKGRACLVYGFAPLSISDAATAGDDYFYSITEFASATTSPSGVVGSAMFRGVSNGDETGTSVFCAGDMNEDGYADFLITAPFADHDVPGEQVYQDVGAVYLIYGKPRNSADELVGELSLGDVGGSIHGAVFYGDHLAEKYGASQFAQAGSWAVGGSDIDGDLIPDLLLGVPNATRVKEDYYNAGPNQIGRPDVQFSDMGAAFIVYGGSLDRLMDTDCDGVITGYDYLRFYAIAVAGQTGGVGTGLCDCPDTYIIADLNRDGVVDAADFSIFDARYVELNP